MHSLTMFSAENNEGAGENTWVSYAGLRRSEIE
jgi:hypothetical protein